MTAVQIRNLAVLTVRDPASAARLVMATNLPREALWTALALAVVLNTLIYSLSDMISPTQSPFPPLFQVPAFYLAVIGFGLVASIYAMHWIGRMMGGQGTLDDIMSLIVWLQFMRIAVQTVALFLTLSLPLLAVLLGLVASLMGLFITLHFVDQAHRFQSLGRAAFVLIGSAIAVVVFVSIVMTLVGATFLGSESYV